MFVAQVQNLIQMVLIDDLQSLLKDDGDIVFDRRKKEAEERNVS